MFKKNQQEVYPTIGVFGGIGMMELNQRTLGTSKPTYGLEPLTPPCQGPASRLGGDPPSMPQPSSGRPSCRGRAEWGGRRSLSASHDGGAIHCRGPTPTPSDASDDGVSFVRHINVRRHVR